MATLSIAFPLVTPTPQAGYRVIYWPTSSPASAIVITPNPTASPVVINNLNATSYSGTVEASCGGGNYSTPSSFSATTTVAYFSYYISTQQTSSFNACGVPPSNLQIFSSSNNPNGSTFYTNSALTTLFVPTGGGGYFSIDTVSNPVSTFTIFIDNGSYGYSYSSCYI